MPLLELDKVLIALPVGNLQDAEAVTQVIEAHGFGIDSDIAFEDNVGRQVVLMQENSDMRLQYRGRNLP